MKNLLVIFRFERIYTTSMLVLAFFVSLLLSSLTLANEITISEAIKYHDAGRTGDNESTEKSVSAFKKLLEKSPENPLLLAYLGSSYALTARDSSAVVDKVRFTNRGLRYLDKAVVLAPEDFVVRLIRGTVSSQIPAMFGRKEVVIEDFLLLDKIYSSNPNNKRAQSMVDVYQQLSKLLPAQKDNWAKKLQEVRSRVNQ